jgi:hypothetical protein
VRDMILGILKSSGITDAEDLKFRYIRNELEAQMGLAKDALKPRRDELRDLASKLADDYCKKMRMAPGLQDKPEPEEAAASSSIDSSSTMFRVVSRAACCQAACFPASEATPPH